MEDNGDDGALNGLNPIDRWLIKHDRLYVEATRSPFILSIRDGMVNICSFMRWLVQDYMFVREFVPFVASVLLKAYKESDDRSDVEVILRGLASLHDELAWFKREAYTLDVPLLGIAPQKPNQDYCRFLESLMSPEVDYTVAITAFWAIEAVYQESFSLCLEGAARTPYRLVDTCERWGNERFKQYCNSLRIIANRRLENATEDMLERAEEAFVRVLEKEVAFWSMSNGDS